MVDVFIIDGLTKAEVEQQLRKYMESLRIVNTYHPTSECLYLHRLHAILQTYQFGLFCSLAEKYA